MSTNLSEYTLIELSSAQNSRAIASTWTAWNRGLAPSSFERVAETLNSPRHAWAADGRYKAWALVLRSEASKADVELVSHCETIRRDAVLARGGTDREAKVVSYGVASVFTPEQHRGKGFATRMLQLLHYVLAPSAALPPFPPAWGPPPAPKLGDAAFSVLYSDVGPDMYARATIGEQRPGWVARPVLRRVWPLAPQSGPRPNISTNEALRLDAMHALEQDASLSIAQELPRLAAQEGKPCVAILPDPGWFRMFSTREALAREAGDRPDPSGPILRAAFRDPQTHGYVVYTAETQKLPPGGETRPKRLVVNWVKEPVQWKQLERVARAEWCTEIEVWGHEEFNADAGGPEPRIEDKDHIPCIASYVGEDLEWKFCDQ